MVGGCKIKMKAQYFMDFIGEKEGAIGSCKMEKAVL